MRRLSIRWFLPLVLVPFAACSPDDGRRRDGGSGDGMVLPPQPDEDGDGISDGDEGRGESRDTDADGTPDYLDDDSDGDSIQDSLEAGGDMDARTPPVDSDLDGMPDFVDSDSDGNGIMDVAEGTADADSDGIEDFRDTDDDNDYVDDITELPTAVPTDFDGDGFADFRDPDADNDYILDGHERIRIGDAADTDGDGTPDWQDDDSDDDGWLDSEEAGDMDIRSIPDDTDMDGVPDFRDVDSDNDGLSDADELIAGSSRVLEDSDGDMVSDLIEAGAGTDPADPTDSPRTRGDFVFVVPYEAPPRPTRDTLNFETSLQFADLYFNFDTTGSMSAELAAVRNPVTGVPGIITALQCTETGVACTVDGDCGPMEECNRRGICAEDPRTATEPCIPDIWTGVGRFDDANTERNLLSVQADPALTASTIPTTGGGGSEAPHQAVACIARPSICGATTTSSCSATPGAIGCPGFRPEAVKIVVQITDADDQCGGCYTGPMAGADLATLGIKFIGLWGTGDDGGTGTPESIMREIGIAAGSVDGTGAPFVYPAIDAAVVPQTVAAVRALVNADNFRVTIEASELPDDDGDAVRFINYLETNTTGMGRCTMVTPTEDTDVPPDGHDDAFPALRPGIPVCWDVVPLMNTFQMPAGSPLVYKALLTVRADGSEVDTRTIFFLVPPVIVGPGGPD